MDRSAWTNFATPPRRYEVDEMLVRPWSGVICNIQGTWSRGVTNLPGGLEILEFVRVFNPQNVQVMRGETSTTNGNLGGMAIVQFRADLEGFKDATAFEKYFLERNQGREHWIANKGAGESLYGWLARRADYYDHDAPDDVFSRYLKATAKVVDLQSVTDEMEEAHKQVLAKTLTEKNKETECLSQKLDETQKEVQNEKKRAAACLQDANATYTKCQELSDNMDILSDRDSEVASLNACYTKLAESEKHVQHLNYELKKTGVRCAIFEIAARSNRDQLLDSYRELEEWIEGREEMRQLREQSNIMSINKADGDLRLPLFCLQLLRQESEKKRREIEVAKECTVCSTEFGIKIAQKSSHCVECYHANDCHACADKLRKSKLRRGDYDQLVQVFQSESSSAPEDESESSSAPEDESEPSSAPEDESEPSNASENENESSSAAAEDERESNSVPAEDESEANSAAAEEEESNSASAKDEDESESNTTAEKDKDDSESNTMSENLDEDESESNTAAEKDEDESESNTTSAKDEDESESNTTAENDEDDSESNTTSEKDEDESESNTELQKRKTLQNLTKTKMLPKTKD